MQKEYVIPTRIFGLALLALLAFFTMSSCKKMPSSGPAANSEFLTEADRSPWPFTFASSQEGAYGFSWTNVDVRDSKEFIVNATRGAFAANAQAQGIFPSTLSGGNGLYLAQDPFVSKNFGNTLLILKVKPNVLGTMAHTAVIFEGSQFMENFVPAVLSREVLFHYFWRKGVASVIRDADAVESTKIVKMQPEFSKFSTLANPPTERLTVENLPNFITSFSSKVWFDLLSEYALESIGNSEPDLIWKRIVSLEKTSGANSWQIEGITEADILLLKSPTNLDKIESYRKLIADFAHQRSSQWTQEWREKTADSRTKCPSMIFRSGAKEPIAGYSREDMDSPRLVSFLVEPTDVSGIVVTPDHTRRRGDVAWVKLSSGEEGYAPLIQLRCAN